MEVTDLTNEYRVRYIQEGNREKYESSFPELFHHYYRFWANRKLDIAIVTDEEIRTRKAWVGEIIEKLDNLLEENEIDSGAINYVYFIGVGTTNGHAFRLRNRIHVWLPLETYTSERLVQIFVTHETAHGLHYHYSPSFDFDSLEEQARLPRQLITEGLATYLTEVLLSVSDLDALWADYLNTDAAREWLRKCQKEERNIFRLLSDNYGKSIPDLEIFRASNSGNIYQYRSGYYAGLKLIDQYARNKHLSAKQLLTLPRKKFEEDILKLILDLVRS